MLVLLTLFVVYTAWKASSALQCHHPEPWKFFSTKTSYFAVANDEATPFIVPGCAPRALWMLARHGTRYPNHDAINNMIELAPALKAKVIESHRNGKGSLCQADIDLLSAWDLGLTTADTNMLTAAGVDEQHALAERTSARFASLLDTEYTPDRFMFRATQSSRTLESALAFGEAAFPRVKVNVEQPQGDDVLLKFYDYCPLWNMIGLNSSTLSERRAFADSTFAKAATDAVGARLGLDEFSFEQLVLVYDLCKFEKAWAFNNVSVWCAPFGVFEFQVLEYYFDQESYYRQSYGNELNPKTACPLMSDIADTFNSVNASSRVGTFYFAHAETILPFISLLGLYKDATPLTAANFLRQSSREYRGSHLAPFAANVALALYSCVRSPTDRVVTFVQERPVQLPGCEHVDCDWRHFQKIYKEAIQCNFDDICSLKSV